MRTWLLHRSQANSLASQIRDAERQVQDRQRTIKVRTDVLMRTIHQQMTAPTTLLLASGAGFMIGELTKRQPAKVDSSGHKTEGTGISPLKVAINLVTSIQTLYTALPIVWIMKTFVQTSSSGQPSKQQFQATTSASDRPENCKSQS
jgi:hypothetical protein